MQLAKVQVLFNFVAVGDLVGTENLIYRLQCYKTLPHNLSTLFFFFRWVCTCLWICLVVSALVPNESFRHLSHRLMFSLLLVTSVWMDFPDNQWVCVSVSNNVSGRSLKLCTQQGDEALGLRSFFLHTSVNMNLAPDSCTGWTNAPKIVIVHFASITYRTILSIVPKNVAKLLKTVHFR